MSDNKTGENGGTPFGASTVRHFSRPRSPIEMMIDQACGITCGEPEPPKLTDEQKEACARLGRDVVANLRTYYPDVVKTRPTTWPVHLRNTIASEAEKMLRDILSNAESSYGRPKGGH